MMAEVEVMGEVKRIGKREITKEMGMVVEMKIRRIMMLSGEMEIAEFNDRDKGDERDEVARETTIDEQSQTLK